ncbi:lysophospholipid acyltransferase family protein [Marinihelvus fidelis]|uniref:lysophospholipid acyltransferase family protein n=1 Tax=Marinihelvus fidelis TaxID=2613842 RepID=UPI00177D474A|nr:lysophospholipid acyltransferase family protein [Marinihelvus fidelis]
MLLILLCLVGLLPTVVLQGRFGQARLWRGRSLAEHSLMAFSGGVCRVFGLRPRVHGKPLPGPVLITANHIAWLDIELLHSAGAMSFVGKAEIARWPLLGFLAARGGTIFHRRGSHDSAAGVAGVMTAKLAEGSRVAVFPEGGILPGEDIKRFHARLFKVPVEAGCPIQPVMIRYVRDGRRDPGTTFLPGENLVVNSIRLMGRPACDAELWFLPPYTVEDRSRRELAAVAEQAITAAYEQPIGTDGV